MEVNTKIFQQPQTCSVFEFSLKKPDNFIMKVQLQKVLNRFLVKPLTTNGHVLFKRIKIL